jgi:hypothetical protein
MTTRFHPEQKPGEVCLGNFKNPKYVAWGTARIGLHAYDQDGKPYPPCLGRWPVFVSRAELEKAGVSFG